MGVENNEHLSKKLFYKILAIKNCCDKSKRNHPLNHYTKPLHQTTTLDHHNKPPHRTTPPNHQTKPPHQTTTPNHLTRPPNHHTRPPHQTTKPPHQTTPPNHHPLKHTVKLYTKLLSTAALGALPLPALGPII
jgi:hypothetical protein